MIAHLHRAQSALLWLATGDRGFFLTLPFVACALALSATGFF